jgi:hypothetical protein
MGAVSTAKELAQLSGLGQLAGSPGETGAHKPRDSISVRKIGDEIKVAPSANVVFAFPPRWSPMLKLTNLLLQAPDLVLEPSVLLAAIKR